MIGVIYARYSSDSQREESIEGQLRECYAFAEKQGISIIDTYIDRALSAKTDNRPAFQQMIKDSAKQKFDLIIVWKLDRFARNRYDSARYKNTLKKNYVKVVSATENISEGSEGILLESVLEGMAEYYSADLSEKVTRGMTENALKCKFNGGTVPIGYVINKDQMFEVDPVKAPYVVDAFQAYADGKTIKEIVEMLNAKGVTTSHGTKITINIVTDMLKNRRYIGEYKFQDIVNPNGIPRIVPQALFDKVQRERAKNKRATARHKAEDDYLLTTKLFCGKCGVYMTGESGTARNGTVHRYYKCNNAKYKHTCDKKTVKKEWIEDLVVKHTHEMMIDDNVIEDIASIVFRNAKKENPAIQLLKQRLSETENALNNLLRAIEEGIITPTTKQRMIELEQTRDEIKLKLIKEEMKKPTITKEGLVLWLRHIQSMSLETKEHKQRLIDIFVNAVYLYDDKLVITFNYKEASKTVTLKEVNGSIIECSGAPKRPLLSDGQKWSFLNNTGYNRVDIRGFDEVIKMIEITTWIPNFLQTLNETFVNRVWFVGLQGSYGRGEATETSDIDIVVILDELSAVDVQIYNTMLDTLSHRELICGFLSGKKEIMNWEPSDLFQFCHDTTPIRGSLDEVMATIDESAVDRAIKIGACNIFHGCVHNSLYEKSEDILRELYKSASFVVQAIVFKQTGNYILHQKELLQLVSSDERDVVEIFLKLKNGETVDFDSMSERLFAWSKKWISENC